METLEGDIYDDFTLVSHCLAGDQSLQEKTYKTLFPRLVRLLQSRGATCHDAEMIAADVMSECLYGIGTRPPLLKKFSGKSSLSTWVSQVTIHRYIDFLRRKQRMGEEELDTAVVGAESLPDIPEEELLSLVRSAMIHAFGECESTDFVLLQLVHGHLVDQRQVARLFGWSDSKLSRRLSSARESIRDNALSHLRRHEAQLSISWEDLLHVANQISEPA